MPESKSPEVPRVTRFAALVLAVAVAVLVAFAVWSGIEGEHTAAHATAEATASGHRADVLIQRLQQQERDAAAREAVDAATRAELLTMQSELLAEYTRLESSQLRLLRWLHKHGIKVPTRYIVVPQVVRGNADVTTSDGPAPVRPSQAPADPPSTAQPPAPVPTLPNGKPAPGNSGNAPGHNKP